jgi:hypothetical protein
VQIEGALFRAAAEKAQELWEPLTEEEEEEAIRAASHPRDFADSVTFIATTHASDEDQK